MNKWKIAFWTCLMILIFSTGFLVYEIIDQGVTLTYQKEGYANTKNDLNELIKIINQTDLTKSEIKSGLLDHRLYEFMDFESDTIPLERVILIFENNNLKKVVKEW
jgi:hypothetical protein